MLIAVKKRMKNISCIMWKSFFLYIGILLATITFPHISLASGTQNSLSLPIINNTYHQSYQLAQNASNTKNYSPSTNEEADDMELANAICRIVKILQSDVARAIAAFSIVFLGFSLFLGKVSWGVCLAVFIGLGAIFSAQSIVAIITNDASIDNICKGDYSEYYNYTDESENNNNDYDDHGNNNNENENIDNPGTILNPPFYQPLDTTPLTIP